MDYYLIEYARKYLNNEITFDELTDFEWSYVEYFDRSGDEVIHKIIDIIEGGFSELTENEITEEKVYKELEEIYREYISNTIN